MSDPINVVCSNNSLLNYIFTGISSICAMFATIYAFKTHQLHSDEIKKIESRKKIISGNLKRPILKSSSQEHYRCMLTCTLFNKSEFTAIVEDIKVFIDSKEFNKIDWAGNVNDYGCPIHPNEFIEINGTQKIYIRRNDDKELNVCDVLISHSFSDEQIKLHYDFSE